MLMAVTIDMVIHRSHSFHFLASMKASNEADNRTPVAQKLKILNASPLWLVVGLNRKQMQTHISINATDLYPLRKLMGIIHTLSAYMEHLYSMSQIPRM